MAPQPAHASLLHDLRTACARDGMPATVFRLLHNMEQEPPAVQAVKLQRMSLALADDCTPSSPQRPLPSAATNARVAEAEARAIYQGTLQPEAPVHYLAYSQALDALASAITARGHVLPGTYGFIRQSTTSRHLLAGPRLGQDMRVVLSNWMNWQWSALPAADSDPLMRDATAVDPLKPLRVAYALDEDTLHAARIRAELAAPSSPRDDAAPLAAPRPGPQQ